ncbi:MAG: hypothetical protein KatS3mg105_3567 [Gemmatales bacterium]|nr:MAG: hypothetical protein KatS3mg105_3567 [Gemmatales bacterium]
MNNLCPSCGSRYVVKPSDIGKRFSCNKCLVGLVVEPHGLRLDETEARAADEASENDFQSFDFQSWTRQDDALAPAGPSAAHQVNPVAQQNVADADATRRPPDYSVLPGEQQIATLGGNFETITLTTHRIRFEGRTEVTFNEGRTEVIFNNEAVYQLLRASMMLEYVSACFVVRKKIALWVLVVGCILLVSCIALLVAGNDNDPFVKAPRVLFLCICPILFGAGVALIIWYFVGRKYRLHIQSIGGDSIVLEMWVDRESEIMSFIDRLEWAKNERLMSIHSSTQLAVIPNKQN